MTDDQTLRHQQRTAYKLQKISRAEWWRLSSSKAIYTDVVVRTVMARLTRRSSLQISWHRERA